MFYARSKNLTDNDRRNMFLSFVIQCQKFQVLYFIMTFHLEFQVFASMQTRKQSLINSIKLIRSLQILDHVIVVLNSHSFH